MILGKMLIVFFSGLLMGAPQNVEEARLGPPLFVNLHVQNILMRAYNGAARRNVNKLYRKCL